MGGRIELWVMTICTQIMFTAAVTHPNDLAVLNAMKASWKNLPHWKGSDPCGRKWEGINCTNSRVTTLVLAGMGVRTNDIGDIPSLSMLQYLDISNNKGIKAALPTSIQNLNNLTTLILVGCSFRGPIPNSIGSLKKLVFLGLNNNSFTGSIPASIGNLTNLSWLDLSDNRLTGPIPFSNETSSGLDKLVKAKHMHLSNNQLSGPIQSQLFNTNMSLIHVIVNNNQLSGTIPSSIGSVKTLEVIRLDSNSLTGTVPQNLSNLITLSELYLSNNNLSGPIPDLLGMNSLFYVDLSNNSFDKSDIPTWLTLLSLNTILMEKTQLQGEIPSSVFQPQLESLVLSNNNLNGTLDIGNRYSSNLIVDLTNNSITNFTQSSIYNLSLIVDNNPICEAGSTGRYCAAQNPNIPNTLPSNTCPPINCGSFKVLSPNCKCTNPYTGTIYFFSHSFSDFDNATYYTTLHDTLISAFQSRQLPVDSISLNNATVDEYKYLQYRLYIFPSSQEYFDRSSVSTIGTVINRQNFSLPFYGPMFFLDESYCCFPGNKSSNHGVVIGAVVGGLVAVLLIVSAITYGIYQKRQAKKTNQNSPFANWGLDNGSDAGTAPQLKGPRWCSFKELKRCTNNFSEDYIIGSGGFGKVYKGTLETGEVVAIKRSKQESLQGAKEFKTEIELLSRIHHKNVVALVGFCYEKGEQMLVYEHISNGTLKDNLSGEARTRLDWMRRLKIALDSAKGVTYLHELADPPIIHMDIKSNNILLDADLTAKVADFGLSKLLGDGSKGYVSSKLKGTPGYIDPEYYNITHKPTEKSDVYSFGVVLLELLTARSPINNNTYIVREVEDAINNSNGLDRILDSSLGSFQTLGGLTKFADLAMSCVQNSGVDRPSMGHVVREIETIIELALLTLDGDSSLTFSRQYQGNVGDLYHPFGDSVSDASSSLTVPYETELRR